MKLAFLLGAVAQLAMGVMSYSIQSGLARVNEDIIEFGEAEIQSIRSLTLENMKDKLDVELKLDYEDVTKKPHQFVITLGDDNGHDLSFVPNYLSAYDVYKLSIPVNKIPLSLRVKDKLFLKAIVASSGPKKHGENLRRNLAEVRFGDDIKLMAQSAHVPAERFGLKPEIHHQFASEAPTVNSIIPIVFSAGAAVLLLALLVSWVSLLGDDLLGNFTKLSGAQVLNHAVFLASLIGYVAVFYRYYLGTSIFATLFNAFVLTPPSIFFGSRALRDLAVFRKLEVS